jgi:hypothetical protein
MKKLFITALAIIGLMSAQAQESEKENVPDTMRINMGETQVLIIKTPKGMVVIDNETEPNDTIDVEEGGDKEHNSSHDGHWAGFDFGVNMLTNGQFKSSFPNNPQWENDPAKSFYWNFNLLDHRFNIYKEYVGITTGIGLNFNQIGLKNNYILNENVDSIWVYSDTINKFSKNKLRATYLQIPLLLEFNTNVDEDKSFYFVAGVIGGIRLASSVKRKYEQSGVDSKEKVKGAYGLNAFKLDGTVRMGYSDWGVFANYSLLPLFDTNKTEQVYPLTFGLTFNF